MLEMLRRVDNNWNITSKYTYTPKLFFTGSVWFVVPFFIYFFLGKCF